MIAPRYGDTIGPFVAISYEPRQVRKEAAVVADSGTECG